MTKIGIVSMSAKPLHAGHYGLIELAAKECDEAHVYVSLSDRARPGEVPVLGTDMEKVWKGYVEPTLPTNVSVTYGGSPIKNAFVELGKASEERSPDTYVLYGDPDDLATNFPEQSLSKYAPFLWQHGQLETRPVKRTDTVNVSGTKMRQWLADGDEASFIAHLPKAVNGKAIWDILSATAKDPPKLKATARAKTSRVRGEAVIRQFVSEVIGVRRSNRSVR